MFSYAWHKASQRSFHAKEVFRATLTRYQRRSCADILGFSHRGMATGRSSHVAVCKFTVQTFVSGLAVPFIAPYLYFK